MRTKSVRLLDGLYPALTSYVRNARLPAQIGLQHGLTVVRSILAQAECCPLMNPQPRPVEISIASIPATSAEQREVPVTRSLRFWSWEHLGHKAESTGHRGPMPRKCIRRSVHSRPSGRPSVPTMVL